MISKNRYLLTNATHQFVIEMIHCQNCANHFDVVQIILFENIFVKIKETKNCDEYLNNQSE
jgi:hypothetical protein